ncbi:MAG TPA: hypothetical protein VE130_14270 [Nitrososphaeraceae archaeon]|nr:hypothetical protein [Nitrososphaeraceae archaeon]
MKTNKTDQHSIWESFSANNPVRKHPVKDGTNFSERTEKVASRAEQFEVRNTTKIQKL